MLKRPNFPTMYYHYGNHYLIVNIYVCLCKIPVHYVIVFVLYRIITVIIFVESAFATIVFPSGKNTFLFFYSKELFHHFLIFSLKKVIFSLFLFSQRSFSVPSGHFCYLSTGGTCIRQARGWLG